MENRLPRIYEKLRISSRAGRRSTLASRPIRATVLAGGHPPWQRLSSMTHNRPVDCWQLAMSHGSVGRRYELETGDVTGLRARAHALGTTMPFGMWAEAFESHMRRLPPDEVRSLCGGFVGDLGALLRSAAAIAGGAEKLARPYPLGRIGEPADIANAVLFFASPLAVWITGQVLSVSGGYTMV